MLKKTVRACIIVAFFCINNVAYTQNLYINSIISYDTGKDGFFVSYEVDYKSFIDYKIRLIKYNKNAEFLWDIIIDSNNERANERSKGVYATNDGGCIVVKDNNISRESFHTFYKYSNMGELVWLKSYNIDFNDLIVNADDSFFVLAGEFNEEKNIDKRDLAIFKFDKGGNKLWHVFQDNFEYSNSIGKLNYTQDSLLVSLSRYFIKDTIAQYANLYIHDIGGYRPYIPLLSFYDTLGNLKRKTFISDSLMVSNEAYIANNGDFIYLSYLPNELTLQEMFTNYKKWLTEYQKTNLKFVCLSQKDDYSEVLWDYKIMKIENLGIRRFFEVQDYYLFALSIKGNIHMYFFDKKGKLLLIKKIEKEGYAIRNPVVFENKKEYILFYSENELNTRTYNLSHEKISKENIASQIK